MSDIIFSMFEFLSVKEILWDEDEYISFPFSFMHDMFISI